MIKNEPKTNPILSMYAIACALGGKYLCVLCALCGFEQKMQNEPNPVLSEVEWIKQITHFNNKQFSNEPNFKND